MSKSENRGRDLLLEGRYRCAAPVYKVKDSRLPGLRVYILKIRSFPRFMGIIYSAKQCLKFKIFKIATLSSHSLSFFNSCKNICPAYGSISIIIGSCSPHPR